MVTKTTKYGKGYETPQGLEEEQYYELLYEFVDLAKAKGLTVRHAQKYLHPKRRSQSCCNIRISFKFGASLKDTIPIW